MSLLLKNYWGIVLAGSFSALLFADPMQQQIRYTYHPQGTNGAGQLATIDGPRTDVSDITRFEYDEKGHVTKVINPLEYFPILK
ncbi:RHS repeat protein [Endozoicomonas arenosclerae]|uniref:RHS repeat protein n=1 Tax=Endozoicomonas arenosclerae TaxID=1633495 RepID=UPI0007811870|nr:RHS repeat protein [Endozoicomonas arenosclerae]